jgi:hypothetical protein
MFGARTARTALVALTIGLASLVVGGASCTPPPVPHRAAVIVETGTAVHRVVITFSETSITGIEALRRAGANPATYATGAGAAVCSMYGVGRPAGPNCLVGPAGDSRYWAYFRAPAGTSSFTYSRVGAGASQVHDGDVEGWKWGTGAAPTFVSLASLTKSTTSRPSVGQP